MRHSTLFIQETKNKKVLSFFMPFNLLILNIFFLLVLCILRIRATRVYILKQQVLRLFFFSDGRTQFGSKSSMSRHPPGFLCRPVP
jgi:hypothetical protein